MIRRFANAAPTTARGPLLQRKCACAGSRVVVHEGAAFCNERLALQRRATNQAEPSTVPPIVQEVLRSPGQPLDPATRAFMEPRFGHDFSRVRAHTEAKAAESARAVHALAYTVGRDIVFAPGRYGPGTTAGDRLLAHELTHVVQQSEAKGSSPANGDGGSSGAETQAEWAAAAVADGRSAGLLTRQAIPSLQRAEGELLAFEADLEQRKKRVVSIEKSGDASISGSADKTTGNLSGYRLNQDFTLTLAKDARASDYALVQWIKGELYENRKEGKAYWPANTGKALYGQTEKEPWLFKDWIIDSPDADPRFGSHYGLTVTVPTTKFEDSPGIVLHGGELPAGLRWTVDARLGVYPWGSHVPTTIKEWESMRPEPFKELTWGWDITVDPDKKSVDMKMK